MKKFAPLILSGVLLLATVACDNTAKTSQDAPNKVGETTKAPSVSEVQDTQADAQSQVRRDELNADIRAREQRNDAFNNGGTQRTDGDLESEVRDKLEANLPASELTIQAKNDAVTVVGTVPTQEQLDKISPLTKQIKGVKSVNVEVKVDPAVPADKNN